MDEALPDRAQQNNPQIAAESLLVESGGADHLVERSVVGDGKMVFLKHGGDLLRRPGLGQSHMLADAGDQHHADSDGGSVRKPCVAVRLLKPMTERVAEVEHHALACVKLVVLNDDALAIHAII